MNFGSAFLAALLVLALPSAGLAGSRSFRGSADVKGHDYSFTGSYGARLLRGATTSGGAFKMKTTPTCAAPCGRHDVKGRVTTASGTTLTLVGKRLHRWIEGKVLDAKDNKIGRFWILLSRPLAPDARL